MSAEHPASQAWRPRAALELLEARAELLHGIRRYFRQAGVLEVETPICSRYGATDPALQSFTTRYTGPGAARGEHRYLQTSPEFPMKRLLAAGSGAIYQICKVFRDGELGRRHQPEFTLLEWYRPGYDHHALIDEVGDLLNRLLPAPRPTQRLSYRELFLRHLQLDPFTVSLEALRRCSIEQRVPGAQTLQLEGRDAWLDLLLSHRLESRLGRDRLTFVYDYPASQAALSRIRPDEPPVAERFELYLEGMEIANGFHELSDAEEQQARFEAENARRLATGLPPVRRDEPLLAALRAGLPRCAGVAVGLDRLLMVITQRKDIRDVLAFPFNQA